MCKTMIVLEHLVSLCFITLDKFELKGSEVCVKSMMKLSQSAALQLASPTAKNTYKPDRKTVPKIKSKGRKVS